MTRQATDFKIAFLEKIGVPLLSSIIASNESARGDDGAPAKSEAQIMATLLGKSVEFSSKLSDLLDLKQAGENAESVRIALAAVAANLMARYKDVTGKSPDEVVFKRLISAMETSLIFADNFAPSDEHIARLRNMDMANLNNVDAHQMNVQYMNIMVPVVLAVADYTFGRDEKKLVLEISEKLSHMAARTVKSAAAANDDALVLKKQELQVLRAAVSVYTECHRAETARIMDMNADERARLSEESGNFLSMDNLWRNFSNRFAMLELLAGLSQGKVVVQNDSPVSVAEQKPSSTPEPVTYDAPVEEVVVAAEVAEELPVVAQEEQVSQPAAADDASPMSFFTKKRVSNNADSESTDGTMV